MSINPTVGPSRPRPRTSVTADDYKDKSEAIVRYWRDKLEMAMKDPSRQGPCWIGVKVLNLGVRKSKSREGALIFSRQEVIFNVSSPGSMLVGDSKGASLATLKKVKKMVKQGGCGVNFVGNDIDSHTDPQQALDVCRDIRDLIAET